MEKKIHIIFLISYCYIIFFFDICIMSLQKAQQRVNKVEDRLAEKGVWSEGCVMEEEGKKKIQ